MARDPNWRHPSWIDHTDKRYGRLVVQRYLGNLKWECICDCGVTVQVISYLLPDRTSCGCSRTGYKYRPGVKVGEWTLIKKIRGQRWKCQCSCGKFKEINVNSQTANACWDCFVPANKLPPGEAMVNKWYSQYVKGAARRGHKFSLTRVAFVEIVTQDCFYCGSPPTPHDNGNTFAPFICNGIDRIDNKLGYTSANVVPCCSICNKAKGTLTLQEWNDWLNRIISHQTKRGVAA